MPLPQRLSPYVASSHEPPHVTCRDAIYPKSRDNQFCMKVPLLEPRKNNQNEYRKEILYKDISN